MKLPHRRQFLHLATSAVAFSVILHPAHAQIYPARPVTLIVPSAAAGPTDVAARIVGEHMSRTLGQRLVVENVVGAGGTTGSLRAMRARPDGYTIEMGHTGTHAVAVSFYPNLGYKPDTDFEPIGVVVYLPHVIITRKEFPAADIKEFVSYVQANSEKLNLAHTGVGSMTFTNALLLNAALGTKPTLVPFGQQCPGDDGASGWPSGLLPWHHPGYCPATRCCFSQGPRARRQETSSTYSQRADDG
jgi:tripartite-type tricarboxylate transporter receptor subunit TctC